MKIGRELAPFEDTLYHWNELPLVADREKIFLSKVLETLTAARASSILKLKTVYCDPEVEAAIGDKIIDIYSANSNPLFHEINATLIQVITNALQNIFGQQGNKVESFVHFFAENPSLSGIFGYLTFPAICFYFITDEFLNVGQRFILKVLEYNQGALALNICAAYFDSIPEFQSIMWNYFRLNQSSEKSTIQTFLDSLDEAICVITEYHVQLIHEMIEKHRSFAITFFFMYYFPANSNSYLSEYNNSSLFESSKELNTTFGFIVNEQGSALTQIFLSHLETKSKVAITLKYADLNLQIVQAVISGFEIDILFEAMKSNNTIKKDTKTYNTIISDKIKRSLMPGTIQYSPRNIFVIEKTAYDPLIFESDTIPPIEKCAEFSRTWEAIKQLAYDEGKHPLHLITKLDSPKLKKALPYPEMLKNPAFVEYATKETEIKILKAKKDFEDFIILKEVEATLIDITERFRNNDVIFLLSVLKDNIKKKIELDTMLDQPVTTEEETTNAIPYAYMLDLINLITEKKEKNQDVEKDFSNFLTYKRMKTMLLEKYEKFPNNKYLHDIIKRIQAIQNLPLGLRILNLTDILFDLFKIIPCRSEENKYNFLSDFAVEVLAMSGVEDFYKDIVYLQKFIIKMSSRVSGYRKEIVDMWASLLSGLIKSLNQYDKNLCKEIEKLIYVEQDQFINIP